MSKHWSEFKYVDAQTLWQFVEEQSLRIDVLMQTETAESSELCKLLLLGRREMLEMFTEFVLSNESHLGYLMMEHDVFTQSEITQMLEDEYKGD